MKVIFTKRFIHKLSKQTEYIAKDKPIAAEKFEEDILTKSLSIPQFPVFSFRKSTFFADENIREFIFKGYRIIFRVSKHEITVFGLYKWQETLKM